jgi:NitT/TauT family transport system substrate-binding protein
MPHKPKIFRSITIALGLLAAVQPALAEVKEVRISAEYGLGYLPLLVMEDQKLLEQHARAAGLGEIKVTWTTFGGGSPALDALLSGSTDFIATGVAPLVVVWAKSGGAVKGVAGLLDSPMVLVSSNPAVKSVKDFSDKDRIAVPSIKVSIQAVFLQMAAAQAFGQDHWAKLDPLTVAFKHPDAAAALLSGRSELTAHFSVPPFVAQELADQRIHTVTDSYRVLGGPHSQNLVSARKAFHDANPRTITAFLAALEEADAFIQRDPRAAAAVYLKASGSKEKVPDILAQIKDPRLSYTTTPHQVQRIADFMYRTGTVKTRLGQWQDLFFPELHNRPGN